jgi:ATP phosphoribosyltransferase
MTNTLHIAVAKGRIFDDALPLLKAADIVPDPGDLSSRKLILRTNLPDVRLVVIRATDVPTYVAYGAADLGIVGKDVLMEYDGDGLEEGLYEPLDLKIARCRLCVAGLDDGPPKHPRLRVATKYVQTTRRHFASKGMQVEIIKLYGSMELAPLVGLADRIVDLVDTGNTLRENGLRELETIAEISSRLVVNKAAMKMRAAEIKDLVKRVAAAVSM